MNLADIETAIGQHLRDMPGVLPIAWPNRDFAPDGPYLEFRHAPNRVVDPVISGGFEYNIGIALVTVVVPAGGFSSEANGTAQAVANRFPKALRIGTASGTVVINGPPNFGNGFQDGAYWRQPVTIPYITEGGNSSSPVNNVNVDVSASNDGLELVGGALRLDIDDLPLAPGG